MLNALLSVFDLFLTLSVGKSRVAFTRSVSFWRESTGEELLSEMWCLGLRANWGNVLKWKKIFGVCLHKIIFKEPCIMCIVVSSHVSTWKEAALFLNHSCLAAHFLCARQLKKYAFWWKHWSYMECMGASRDKFHQYWLLLSWTVWGDGKSFALSWLADLAPDFGNWTVLLQWTMQY